VDLRQLAKHFSTLVLFFVIAGFAVLLVNLPNIYYVLRTATVINPGETYDLGGIKNKDLVQIRGSVNSLFKSNLIIENEIENYYFSLSEYDFDFILVTEKDYEGEFIFTCMDVSESESVLKDDLVELFNSPVELSETELGEILNEENREMITSNTAGSFGDDTRLLDCTSHTSKEPKKIFISMLIEFIGIYSGLLVLWIIGKKRRKLLS
jgi:hypothetical protein